jgi:hypothetical protein
MNLLTGHLPTRINTAATASRLDSRGVNTFPTEFVQSARGLGNAERIVIVSVAATEGALHVGFRCLLKEKH